MPKYVLDTNLFIHAFREPSRALALQRFHAAFAPFEYLSVVVAQELCAGARTVAVRRAVERHVLAPFERRGRVVVPSARAWRSSGEVLAELAREDGLELHRISKAFGNDILIALSCAEAGMVLVTENARDFRRIARHVNVTFVEPWPEPRG